MRLGAVLAVVLGCGSSKEPPSPAPPPRSPEPRPELRANAEAEEWSLQPQGAMPAIKIVLDNGTDTASKLTLRRGPHALPLEVAPKSARRIRVLKEPMLDPKVAIVVGSTTYTLELIADETVVINLGLANHYRVTTAEYSLSQIGARGPELTAFLATEAFRVPDHPLLFEPLPEKITVDLLNPRKGQSTTRSTIERIESKSPPCRPFGNGRLCDLPGRTRVHRTGRITTITSHLLVDLAPGGSRTILVDGVEVVKSATPRWIELDEGVVTLAVTTPRGVVDQVRKVIAPGRVYVFAPRGEIAYQLQPWSQFDVGIDPDLRPLGGIRFFDASNIEVPGSHEDVNNSRHSRYGRLARAGAAPPLRPRTEQVTKLLEKLGPIGTIDPVWADECDEVALAKRGKVPVAREIRAPVAARCACLVRKDSDGPACTTF